MADQYEIALAETKFSSLLELALQQMGSKLRDTVAEQSVSGALRMSPIQQLEPVAMTAVTDRFAPKTPVGSYYTRRWLMATDYEGDSYADTFDLLKTQIDPKGELVSNWAQAAGRVIDDTIINAATGVNYIGTDAGSLSTENFDTGSYQVGVDFGGTASGALIAKLIEGRRILRKNHVDLEMEAPTWVIGSQQEADLLKQSQVASSEFNRNGGVVENGTVTRLYGCNIKVMERLPIVTSNTRGTLLYVKSGMRLGIWQDIKSQVVQRFDLKANPWNVTSVASYGATRTRPGKVVQILCHDTTGGDTNP